MKTTRTHTRAALTLFAAMVAMPFALRAENVHDHPTEVDTPASVNATSGIGAYTGTPATDSVSGTSRAPHAVNTEADANYINSRAGTTADSSLESDIRPSGGFSEPGATNANASANPDVRAQQGVMTRDNSNSYDQNGRQMNSRAGIGTELNHTDAVNLRLQTETVTDSVERASFSGRDQAISLAQRGAEQGREITSSIRSSTRSLEDDARKDVESALRDAERARERLNVAITEARSSTERRWDGRREQLAERFEDYAEKLEEARETAVNGGARFETQISRSPANTPDTQG